MAQAGNQPRRPQHARRRFALPQRKIQIQAQQHKQQRHTESKHKQHAAEKTPVAAQQGKQHFRQPQRRIHPGHRNRYKRQAVHQQQHDQRGQRAGQRHHIRPAFDARQRMVAARAGRFLPLIQRRQRHPQAAHRAVRLMSGQGGVGQVEALPFGGGGAVGAAGHGGKKRGKGAKYIANRAGAP